MSKEVLAQLLDHLMAIPMRPDESYSSEDDFVDLCYSLRAILDVSVFGIYRFHEGLLYPMDLFWGEASPADFATDPIPCEHLEALLAEEKNTSSLNSDRLLAMLSAYGYPMISLPKSCVGIRVVHCSRYLGFVLLGTDTKMDQRILNSLHSLLVPRLLQLEVDILRGGLDLMETRSSLLNLLQDVDPEYEQGFLVKSFPIISRLLDAERTSMWVYGESTQELHLIHGEGLSVINVTLKPGDGLAGRCFSIRKTFFSNDPYNEKHFDPRLDHKTGYKTESVLVTPILKGDRVSGVLQVLNKEGGFTYRDMSSIREVAASLASHVNLYTFLKSRQEKVAV
ncbi:GAF domain-containing protein [bacterium]|nr:GAF domain-containing protein [bacterium]